MLTPVDPDDSAGTTYFVELLKQNGTLIDPQAALLAYRRRPDIDQLV